MRNRALHDALKDFALEAAQQLTHEVQQGAEIPFDVIEEPGGRTVLYNYRPLTTEFIAARWRELRGFEMEHDRLDLGDGLFLIAGDKLDAPPAAVWSDTSGQVEHGREPNVLCVLRRDVAADAPMPMAEARSRFRRLLTALRLFKP